MAYVCVFVCVLLQETMVDGRGGDTSNSIHKHTG